MIPERQSRNLVIIELIADHWLGYSRKENSRGLRTYFFEKPLEFFNFFTLPLEIPDKTKLHPWKSHKIALDSLGIARPNHQSSLKFHIIFSWLPLEISFAISLIPLEIPYPPPPAPHPVWFSSGTAHLKTSSWLRSYLPACKLRRFLRAWFTPAEFCYGGQFSVCHRKSLFLFPFDFWWESHGFYSSFLTIHIKFQSKFKEIFKTNSNLWRYK